MWRAGLACGDIRLNCLSPSISRPSERSERQHIANLCSAGRFLVAALVDHELTGCGHEVLGLMPLNGKWVGHFISIQARTGFQH